VNNHLLAGKEPVGEYVPIVDCDFNVIAYEAAIRYVEPGSNQADFDFSGFDGNEITNSPAYFYQYQAIKNYKGEVPLLVYADGREAFPDFLPIPEKNALIIPLLKKENLNYEYLDTLQNIGTFALEENREGILTWPFSGNFAFPKFIKLGWDNGKISFIRSQILDDGDNSEYVDLFFTPFKQIGIQFIVNVTSEEDFEFKKSYADAFMGPWVTKKVAVANK